MFTIEEINHLPARLGSARMIPEYVWPLKTLAVSGRLAILTFFTIAFAFCVPSLADSDGSFCISRGYIAYELRNGITPGVPGHVLKVVRFEPKRGIHSAGETTLQDFQVHRMTCGQDRVEISGWGNIFKKYTIDSAEQEKLHIIEYTEDPARQFDASKDEPEPAHLGDAQPGPLALESLDPDHKYTLLLSARENPVEGGVKHYRKAELVQTDPQGIVSERLVLYENEFLETID
jgi:hypothetical protein